MLGVLRRSLCFGTQLHFVFRLIVLLVRSGLAVIRMYWVGRIDARGGVNGTDHMDVLLIALIGSHPRNFSLPTSSFLEKAPNQAS